MRMRADKAFVMLDGRTLLAEALDLARSLTGNVRIVGEAAKFEKFGMVVEDIHRGCGPLGGIHAALRASAADLNLILAVDMPFVPRELLKYLIAKAQSSPALVTVPRLSGGWQPLCAVYRQAFADVAEKALRGGRYKIDSLFEAESTQTVDEGEMKAAGFSAKMFRNLNTPEELAQASNMRSPE